MKIANREIGPGHPVYIIAEAGLAHLGSLDLAMKMLHDARAAGADAFKTQFWDVRNSHRLYSGPRKPSRHLSLLAIESLADECGRIDMHFLCTPHDEYALDCISKICPAIKIGSGERGNLEFIKEAMKCELPVIISLGGYTETEIEDVETISNTETAFLFCISKYPTIWKDIEGLMPDFRNSRYDGWSSHTGEDTRIDLTAVAAGAKIIEKHIKPDLLEDIETSMDMKAARASEGFYDWCEYVRCVDRLFP